MYKTPSEAAGQSFDYIICAHKAINPESFPQLFKDVVDDNTTFVIIQNGAGNEDPYRKEFPKCTIISVVTWTAVTQIEPGVMKHIKLEETHLGLFPNPDLDAKLEQQRLDRFVELLKGGKTHYEVHNDIQIPRWEKMIWNAVWNFTSMITECNSKEWRESSPEAEAMTKRLMREILSVGIACGVKLEYELVDRWYQKMTDIGGVYGSTYVDMKERRPMEIEIILGTPLRKARELGMEGSVPTLSSVYALSVAIDWRIQAQKKA